jgi:hypothetical protein
MKAFRIRIKPNQSIGFEDKVGREYYSLSHHNIYCVIQEGIVKDNDVFSPSSIRYINMNDAEIVRECEITVTRIIAETEQ